MVALCLMFLVTYYAFNYSGIIGWACLTPVVNLQLAFGGKFPTLVASYM